MLLCPCQSHIPPKHAGWTVGIMEPAWLGRMISSHCPPSAQGIRGASCPSLARNPCPQLSAIKRGAGTLLLLSQGIKKGGIPGMEQFVWQRKGTGSPPGGASHVQIPKKFREIQFPLPGSSCTPQGSACPLPVPKAVSSMGQCISSMARTHSSWYFQGS